MLSEVKENQLIVENLENLDENDRNEQPSVSSKIIIMYYIDLEALVNIHFNYLTQYTSIYYWTVSECECDARGRQNVIDYRGDFCVIKSNLEGKPCKLLTGKIINEVPSGHFMETWVRCEENGRRLIECPEGNIFIEKEY